jgi:hypothetical protein
MEGRPREDVRDDKGRKEVCGVKKTISKGSLVTEGEVRITGR